MAKILNLFGGKKPAPASSNAAPASDISGFLDGFSIEGYTDGDPGRTSCMNATPASASALSWATAPTVLAGVLAPPSTNGLNSIAWFEAAYTLTASSIVWSQTSGELQFANDVLTVVSRTTS